MLIDPSQGDANRIRKLNGCPKTTDLPILISGTRLHLGVVVALIAAVGAWVFLWRTSWGFRVRAVGESSDAAAYAGMPVKRMTMLALTLSGAMCGLAGAVLVFGSESHRLYIDGSSAGFTGSAGFNGIVTALFGGLHPLWTIPSSFLFGGLLVGANAMQRAIQIPSYLVGVLNGLVVVFVVSAEKYKSRLAAWLNPSSVAVASAATPASETNTVEETAVTK
ncbi:MAG: ABC transporter permease [Acidimicrobiales bacterium]